MTPAARSTGDGRSDNEPRTEAGRALLDKIAALDPYAEPYYYPARIRAIEREAATPPSPAAGGLRELAQAAVDEDEDRRMGAPTPRRPAMNALRAALASGASSETAGLDVSRLARALENFGSTEGHRTEFAAAAIAAEYARLTPVAGSASEEAGRR